MKLIIEDDEGRKTVVPVLRDEITIGRNEQNLVRLAEKNVSRRHGRLLREEGHYYIEDLNSFTGIRVNGEKVEGKRLVHEGDLIQISEYDLILMPSPEERPAPAAVEGAAEPSVTPPAQEAAAGTQTEANAEAQARRMAETATIRLSDLKGESAEVPVQEVPEEKRPKLVGISGKYRGEELVLDRSPIRLGRSDENDLQIEHPSISRKHLRLHLDNGIWKVMDAESRNGVRVNGESYAQIGLRHGDTLEVGHLRFAFVEPRRSFQLPPELTPLAGSVGPLAASPPRTALWVGVGMGSVALLAAGIFLLLRHGANEEVAQRAKAERDFALRTAGESGAAHRYSEALHSLDAARRAGAGPGDLKDYPAVEREARSEELYREMEAAAASQDWERARKLLDTLTPGRTFYGGKAAEKASAITAGYVNLHVAAAAMMKGKDNAGCLAEARLALAANPESADASSLADACRAPTVKTASVAAPPARPAANSSRSTAVSSRPSRPRPYDEAEARRLLNEGNQKLLAQDPSGAVALFQKALTLKPGNPTLGGVYRSMGIAFTRQGNIEEGAHYYRLYVPLCTNPAEKAQLQKVLDDYEARRR
jgi:pSer/pThr/pTyr-binding forkhead associated (FHA) protein/tetratricopeptide (TPR) repeat protein